MATSPLQDLLDTYVPSAGLPVGAAPNALRRLAWLLFLVVKHRLLPPHPDLVSLFHLLLAVVATLRDHAPWVAAAIGSGDEAAQHAETLAALAAVHKASAEEVRAAQHSCDQALIAFHPTDQAEESRPQRTAWSSFATGSLARVL